jgi:hypothetical protein
MAAKRRGIQVAGAVIKTGANRAHLLPKARLSARAPKAGESFSQFFGFAVHVALQEDISPAT